MRKPRIATIVTRLLVGLAIFSTGTCADQGEELIKAAHKGDLTQVKDLLGKGADVNAKAKDGQTALMWASADGHLDVVRLLLERGAHVSAKDQNGNAPLTWASIYGRAEIVSLLLQKGSDANNRNDQAMTPLLWASTYGHPDVVKLLLEKGADMNAKDSHSMTALMRACTHGHSEIVRLLLEKGADTNIKDSNGATALDLAWKEGHNKMERFLIAHGTSGAQAVYEKDGNVFLRDTKGTEIQLTFSGDDSQPSLSPDGASVVFVRGTENEPIDAGVSGADADELWVMDINSKKAETVLRPRAASNMAEVIAGISVPQFSQDSKSIYFLTAAWATSGAVHRLDLPTKEERFVAAGNRVKVIRTGEYDGFLRVNQKRYYKGGGTYWCDYVLTPDGKEVKVIEDSCEE